MKLSIFSMKMPTWTWCGHTNNCSKINKISKIYYLSSIIHFCFLMKLLGVQYGEHSIKNKNLPPISKYLQILGGIKALTSVIQYRAELFLDCLAFLFCVSVARIISVDTGNDIDWKRLIMPRKTSKSLPFVFSAVSQLKFFSNPFCLEYDT